MIKPGVRIFGIRPELALAYSIVSEVFRKYGATPVITSCIDGKHMNASLHYAGAAMDLRSRDIIPITQGKILVEGKEALGDDFDFILEGDHFHLEFQPKNTYGT